MHVTISALQKPTTGRQSVLHLQQRLQLLEDYVKEALPDTGYYTILTFGRILHRPVAHDLAVRLGKRAVQVSELEGLPVGKVPDPVYGCVNVYRRKVLERVFAEVLSEELHIL
jgi:hypothetical protein